MQKQKQGRRMVQWLDW